MPESSSVNTAAPRSLFGYSLDQLRQRASAKWSAYGDLLPFWVAEMDVELAEPIQRRLREAIELGDTGYARDDQVGPSLARYAKEHWAWDIDPNMVLDAPDVSHAVSVVLGAATQPGDKVVISTPIYPPFYRWIKETRTEQVEVPFLKGSRWEIDFDGLRAAFADGAKAFLLCNPANPIGRAWTREELARLADLAAEYDVVVIADEIHAPLALEGATFTPFLTSSESAPQVGVSVLAASKGWNLAGLKCAQVILSSPRGELIRPNIGDRDLKGASLFGVLATMAAYDEGHEWLTQVVAELSQRRDQLTELIATKLPKAKMIPAEATYLAWVDLNAYGVDDDPAQMLMTKAKVAFSSGPNFGTAGNGHIRINFATSADMLEEGINRVAEVLS